MAMGSGRIKISSAVGTLTDFRHGSVRAETFTDGVRADVAGTGQLPAEHVTALRAATAPTYVVYSYRTPIAWHTVGAGWTQPTERYSVTTSNHQGIVAGAVPSVV